MTRKRALVWRASIAAPALLVAAALVVQPSCSDTKEGAEAGPTAWPASSPQAVNAPQPQWGNTTISPDPVADNLLKVLSDWGDREVAVLERSVTLKSMWCETHSTSQEYEWEGVAELRSKLRAHPFFKQRAEKLTRGHLTASGAIQTQGQLYDFLAAS